MLGNKRLLFLLLRHFSALPLPIWSCVDFQLTLFFPPFFSLVSGPCTSYLSTYRGHPPYAHILLNFWYASDGISSRTVCLRNLVFPNITSMDLRHVVTASIILPNYSTTACMARITRVTSWNIRGLNSPVKQLAVLRTIKRLNADVICLQ